MKMGALIWLAGLVPAHAETGFAVVSGNWAGPEGGGVFFTATLEQEADTVRLSIWDVASAGAEAIGEPRLDVDDFALSAYAIEGGQRLEVVTSEAAIGRGFGSGSILQMVTEFADEEAKGVSIVQIQSIDGNLLVTGYYHQFEFYSSFGANPLVFECVVDVWNGTVTVDGTESALPPMDYEAMRAGGWSFGAAFDRGWCPRT